MIACLDAAPRQCLYVAPVLFNGTEASLLALVPLLAGAPTVAAALAESVTHQRKFKMLQVAQSAVNQLARCRRGACAPIAAFNQRDAQTARGSVVGDPGAIDSATDHQHIEAAVAQGSDIADQRKRGGHSRFGRVSHERTESRRGWRALRRVGAASDGGRWRHALERAHRVKPVEQLLRLRSINQAGSERLLDTRDATVCSGQCGTCFECFAIERGEQRVGQKP